MYRLVINGDIGVEVWFPVEGFEGYLVSNYGHFKGKYKKDQFKKTKVDKDGYEAIEFWKQGKAYFFRAHRIVYETFKGKIPEGYQINHKDENKRNNRIENLEPMTCKENINYGTGIERRARQQEKPVLCFDLEGNFLKRYNSVGEAAEKLHLHHVNISKICLHRYGYKTTGGYTFEYADRTL